MAGDLRPGDVVTCSSCGATATAYTTGDPAAWTEGRALLISWGGYRHQAVHAAPATCAFCLDGTRLRAPPTRRVAICDDLALRGCRVDGFEWCTEAELEDAYQFWVAAGSPRCALVAVHTAPASLEVGKSATLPTLPPPPAPVRGQMSLL